MQHSSKHISIVGSGLIGSLLSIFLSKRGHKVSLFERRPDYRTVGVTGGRSINLALSDRGWKAIEMAGIADEIRKIATPMYGRMMHAVDGKLSYQAYGKDGQAIYSVSRGDLNYKLFDLAIENHGVEATFNARCTGINLENNRFFIEDVASGKSSEHSADYVFGTDGAYSAIRGEMMKNPRFNYSQYYIEHGYKELEIPAGPDGKHLLENNCLHIWPRGGYMLIALPNMDGSFTCTLFFPFEGADSFASLDTPEKVDAFFLRVFPDAHALMPTLLTDFFANPTSALVTVRCSPWNHNKALLLGDAAHAVVPFFGQGMNCGFEDCTTFVDYLDRFNEDFGKAFDLIGSTRHKDSNAIADLALGNFIEMRDLVADPKFLFRKKIEAKINSLYPEKWIPQYSMVTFSHIPYSEAQRLGRIQDKIMEGILAIPGIESNWESLDYGKHIDFSLLA